MKGSRFTKFICLLLSVMMVLMLLPGSTLADVTNETSSDESEQVAVTDGDAEETEEAEEPEQDEAALEALEEEESEEPVILYTVNFYVEKDLFETQLIEAGGTASPATPSTPNKEEYAGMEFLYWYVSNEDVKFYLDTPITDHLDLHAHFGVAETEEPVAKSAALGTILPEGTFLKTYIFMVNGSQWGDTQIVATGDTLHEPATPTAAAGMRFVGWFDSGNNQFTSFGTQTVEETTTVTLHAVFVTAYYAFFYNAAGTAILETREPDGSNQVSTTNVTALQVAVDEAVTGWSYTMGGSAVGDTIIVSGTNVNLFPIIEKVKWVSFNSNGGTYVSPMHVAPNTTLTAAMVATYVDSQVTGTVITRAGYTFSAWSGFTFGTIVTSDITLNASWTANTNTPYMLVYWIENADDANYSFEKTVGKTGTSGATITPTTAELAATNLDSSYSAYFNNGTTAGGQTINGDGSSIVNIYCTRKTYTLTFTSSGSNVYSNTFKFDQDISAVWAVTAIKDLLDSGHVWKSSLTNYYYSFLQKMPGSNVTMTATLWSGYLHMWYYYLETLDGTAATAPAGAETTTSGGITYYKSRTVTIYASDYLYLTYAEDYYPITGFTQRDGTVPDFTYHPEVGHWKKGKYIVDQEAYYDASLYYRRSSYSLTFINGDTTNTISSIKYEASIEGQYYEPTRPTGVPTNFVFTGWYTTEGGYAGSEFTWTGATMPAKNLVLYAVWKAPTFTGIAHLTVYGTGGGTYDLGTIPYGGTISSSALNAAREEADLYKPNTTDTFGGWLIDRGGSRTLFNANMQIYEDVVLYPQWISGVSYHVTYNLSGATGNLPADLSSYGVGAKAVVLDIDSTVVAPTGKVFTGWRVGTTGPVYYPGSAVTISGNTTLYAVWSDTASLVSITYDGNGNNSPAASSTYTVPVVNNTIHYVLGGDLFTYTGKEFVEWNTQANGLGIGYDPNDPALISASQPSSPTTLYAIWRTATYSVNASVTPSGTGSITGGTGTFDFGTDTTVTWTVAAGYAVSSVTDNTVPVSVTGNFYTLNDLSSSHTIVVTLAKTSFNLTYNGNGGTSGGSGSHSSTLTIGDPYIVEANTFTNAGHYFVGWSTTSGGPAESAYAPGTNHDMPAADVTLYAIWADKMDLVLTANSAALNYNEEAQSVTGFTGNISGLTYGGTTTAGASGTNPGQYTATFTGQTNLVILQSGTDVTDRYTVSFVNGTLTINPKVSYINGATGAQYAYEWVDYGTGDASYSLAPDQNVTVGTVNYYWTGTWDFPAANNLIANKTITALYATNKQLTITGNSDIVTYDGNGHLIEEATLSDPDLTVSGYTVSGSGTNAGTYDVLVTLGPSFKIMSGTTDVTYQYDVSTAKGTLTINPATLTVTANDETLVYPQTRTAVALLGYTVTSGLVGTQTAGFGGILAYKDGFATQPLPGSYANAIEQGTLALADHGTFLAANYTLNFVKGDVDVSSGTFSVSLTGTSAEYDGGAHSATLNGTQSGDGIQYFVREGGVWIPVSYTPSVTNVNDGPKEIKVIVSRTGYTNAEATATLTITPVEVTVTADSRSMTFGNTATLTPAEGVTYAGFVNGESSSVVSGTGSLTYTYRQGATVVTVDNDLPVGSYSITPNIGGLTATNYTFVPGSGTLAVGIATMTVDSLGYNGTYDGDPHDLVATASIDGMTILYSATEGSGYSEDCPSYTNAGTYTVYFKAVDPDGNYAEATGSAQIVITKAVLTVTADDRSMTYGDMASLTAEGASYSGFADGDSLSNIGMTGSVTFGYFAGATSVTVDATLGAGGYTIKPNVSALSSANYTFTPGNGTLTVNKAIMTVGAIDVTHVYDGTAYSVIANAIPDDPNTVIYYNTTGGTMLSDYFEEIPEAIDVADSTRVYFLAVNPNYEDATGSAMLTITPAVITVTADNRSMTYGDTTTLTPAEGVTYAGFVNSETSSVISGTGSITYTYRQGATVVTVDNTLDAGGYSIIPGVGGLSAANYSFVPGNGTLTVGIATMTVDSLGYSGTYDGDPHDLVAEASVPGMTISYTTVPGGMYFPSCPSATNAGTYTVYFKAVDPDGNYADATGSADIVITKAVLTVTADDRSMTYGDSSATPAAGVSYSGFVNSETASVVSGTVGYNYYDSTTEVFIGSTLGAGSYDIKPDISGLSATNYTFQAADGTLTVNPATMEVTSDGYDELYDGAAHGLEAEVTGLTGMTITYSDSATGTFTSTSPEYTNAGTYTVYFKAVDLAGNYSEATGSADIVIHKVEVTVTPDNRSMTYGNTATLTPAEDVSYSGFITGENESVVSGTGSITYTYQEGAALVTVDNTLDAGGYSIIPGVGGLSAANYTFVSGNGTLTVNRATGLAINATSYNEKYDGGEHGIGTSPTPAEGTTLLYSLTGGTNLSAYTLTSNPMFKNAMSAKTVYVAAVNDNYVTVFDQATVTITRRIISLTSASETRAYNGSPLSLPNVAVTGDGFVTGEGFVTDPQSTVSITNVSSVTNAYNYPAFITGTNVDNYAFYKSEGTLEITAVEVTVTADNQSMTYGDSSATPAAGVSYSGFVNSETASVVSGTVGYNYYDGATEVFIGSTLGAGSYDITPDLSGITATNYTFKAADGTLTVNPATMEVTSDGYDELYDGAPHGLEAEVTGLTGMTITYSDSATGTFTSTSPEYTNAGTYTVYFKAVDLAGNYSEATGSADIVIHKVEVTVTPDNRSMTYGNTATLTPAEDVSYSGFITGENESLVSGTVGYGYFDGAASVTISNTLPVKGYDITPDVSGLSATNYTFKAANGTLTVNPATMTVGSTGTVAVYDGLPYDLTATASVGGMTILYSATEGSGYTDTCPTYTNAGTYTVYFKAIDPDGNYAEASGHADIVITKAVLTVTAIDRSMTYGDMTSLTVEDASFSGFAFGDDLSNIGMTGSVGYYYFDGATLVTVDATLGAGSYTITPYVGSLSSANYTFVPADGTLTVSKATMTVAASDVTHAYDGTAYSVIANATPDDPNTVIYYNTTGGTMLSDYFEEIPEAVDVADSTEVYFMAVNPNYEYATGSATLTITPVEVTVRADNQSMTYGDTTAPAETVTYEGFVNSENATSAGVTGSLDYNYYDGIYVVAVSSTLDAGSYIITPDVSGISAPNYSFVPANGTLTVHKSETLTVSADDVTGPYNGSDYMVNPTASDLSGTDFWYSLTDSTDSADYSMTPPSLVNVGDSARVYLMATNLNYENAFGSALVTITPVELTVTPDDQYMIYGDTTLPAESSVITGFVNGENETTAGVSGSIDYNYFDGTTPVTVSSTLPAGDYTIEVGLSNLTAPNYTFTNASGALNVARSESLTVDATDISEMYNGETHMVTPLASDMSADTTIWYSLTDSTDPADYSTTAPVLVDVADSATVYLMATNPNYYPAFGEAEVDITPRTIAIVTNGANKVYDATPLTDNGWSLGAGNDGFASTEGFLSAEAVGTITNAGFVFNTFDYTLTSNTLPGNYDFDITEGVLIISARPVIVALDPAEKNSGDPDPAFTFHYLTFPGLYDVLPGTGATVNLIRTDALAVTGEDIGVHTDVLSINVVFADATAASNYAIVPQNADFTIHPQVTYNLDTLDAVTGFPATEWFDYLSDATIADATGVARLGYVLTGWTDDLTGDPIALGTTITGIDRNYSLTAVWELARYNVFYNANTAMDVNNMPGTQVNIPYTSLTALSDRVPTRAGFTFVHWDTAEVPGQISYDPGETFTMPNSDVTFSAVWEPDLTPVYYHANGGVGGTIEDGPFGTLTTVTVAGNGFTRPGYRFIGWSTTPTGAVSAQPGDTFMMPILQVNYYAQWEQVLYTVTYIVNGGTTAGLDGAVPYAEYTDLAYGDAMPVPADPAQDGYTFAGWTTAVPATVPEGGLTIYGTMTENTPEIIPDEPTPLAGASWALLNLILAIATALGSVLMLIGLIGKKRKEELEGVVVRETKKHPVTRLMTLLPAIGGIIAFILTENMKNPMTFVDRWTILMAVIAVLQIALVILGVKKDKEVDPESAK